MKCPRDAEELKKEMYEAEIEVDHCPRCHGFWLDEGELQQIQETKERDYSDELKNTSPEMVAAKRAATAFRAARQKSLGQIICPKCQGAMNSREFGAASGVYVDVCSACRGIWLDKGELKSLEICFEQENALYEYYEKKEQKNSFWGRVKSLFKEENG
ncbi:zf-TFIIB domain-containing protein [Candidatus Riflebacteria bacterium]